MKRRKERKEDMYKYVKSKLEKERKLHFQRTKWNVCGQKKIFCSFIRIKLRTKELKFIYILDKMKNFKCKVRAKERNIRRMEKNKKKWRKSRWIKDKEDKEESMRPGGRERKTGWRETAKIITSRETKTWRNKEKKQDRKKTTEEEKKDRRGKEKTQRKRGGRMEGLGSGLCGRGVKNPLIYKGSCLTLSCTISDSTHWGYTKIPTATQNPVTSCFLSTTGSEHEDNSLKK